MTEKGTEGLSIRVCGLEDIDAVLELWRQAGATPSVTDTADDLRRAITESPAHIIENGMITYKGLPAAPLALHPRHARVKGMGAFPVRAFKIVEEPA